MPISESALYVKELAPKIRVTGVSSDSVARAEKSIADVLGKALSNRGAQLANAEAEWQGLQRTLIQLTTSSPAERDQTLATVNAALGFEATVEQVTTLIFQRQTHLTMRQLAPIEIVVVPAGKHWSSMPQWAERRAEGVDVHSEGVSTAVLEQRPDGTTGVKQLIFIPEDNARTQKHELFHLLENVFLSPQAIATLDRAHAQAVKEGGPFARPYGGQRSEFLTTWSELFDGAEGPEGLAYLKKEAPAEIYEVMRDATGRAP